MRILYLITRSDVGGAQVHLLDLLSRLGGRVDPVVGAGEVGYLTDAVRDLGIPCHIVPDLVQRIAPAHDMRALFQLLRLIRKVRPDLVHAHTSKAGLLGRCAARIAGVPSVFTAHTWSFADGACLKWKIAGIPSERLAAAWSSALINVSRANRDLALRYRIASRKRLLVIHNGIGDTLHRAAPARADVPVIAVVARCCVQKDQSLLLRALSRITLPVRAVFVGDGPTRPALEAETRQLGLRDRVAFLGQRLDVPEILAAAHLFALPTKWEGFPLGILEAMRAGLPVVASDTGGVAEAVVDQETGFLVPRGDLDSLRARLEQLLDSPALRRRMGDAGRKRYEAEFTLDAMLRKTLSVYRHVLYGCEIPVVDAVTAPSGHL
ncbi:MAG: glycosyltransferase family 4 protein [Acidobacteria bacterium]|nr:glycosyltransferase family 4 protein [Acidobacteriota bacterium]